MMWHRMRRGRDRPGCSRTEDGRGVRRWYTVTDRRWSCARARWSQSRQMRCDPRVIRDRTRMRPAGCGHVRPRSGRVQCRTAQHWPPCSRHSGGHRRSRCGSMRWKDHAGRRRRQMHLPCKARGHPHRGSGGPDRIPADQRARCRQPPFIDTRREPPDWTRPRERARRHHRHGAAVDEVADADMAVDHGAAGDLSRVDGAPVPVGRVEPRAVWFMRSERTPTD